MFICSTPHNPAYGKCYRSIYVRKEFLAGLATRKSGVGRGFIRLSLQPRLITGAGDFFTPTSRWRTLTGTATLLKLRLILRKISRKKYKLKNRRKMGLTSLQRRTSHTGITIQYHYTNQSIRFQQSTFYCMSIQNSYKSNSDLNLNPY